MLCAHAYSSEVLFMPYTVDLGTHCSL